MKSAHDQEFYLEASWIACSILEDRLLSAIVQSGEPADAQRRNLYMLGDKIEELKQRRADPSDDLKPTCYYVYRNVKQGDK